MRLKVFSLLQMGNHCTCLNQVSDTAFFRSLKMFTIYTALGLDFFFLMLTPLGFVSFSVYGYDRIRV